MIVEPALADPRMRRESRRAAVRGLGELVLTLGIVVLLFAGYEVFVTGWTADGAQSAASADLDRTWAAPAGAGAGAVTAPAVGKPALRLHIPGLGPGWARTVLEGVGQDVLASGPGHYPGSALPGTPGNVALAGHRVGHGAPFDGLGELHSCDALVLETRGEWFVYRLLPFPGEVAGWTRSAAARPRCKGIDALGGSYSSTPGREIVPPTAGEVVAPVPRRPGVAPERQLLTLTTCHPRFSARQRLVLHAVLVTTYAKAGHPPQWRPSELDGI